MDNIDNSLSFEDLFTTKKIEKLIIPKIQRDYAQGRDTNTITRSRNKFITALFDVLTSKKEELKLDFVYGTTTDGCFIPLDGQQRLTTLFLLYWYIGKREVEDVNFLSNFTYETRQSSKKFCKKLIEETDVTDECKISEQIKNNMWYIDEWDFDPTIKSMLVVLDAIDEKYKRLNLTKCYYRLGKIKFYFLDIKDIGTTDDIYIKMNSRGKPLTEFELFKSELDKNLKKLEIFIKDFKCEIKNIDFIEKIDTTWTDWLWPYAMESRTYLIDEYFVNYFKFICYVIYFTKESYYKEGGSSYISYKEFKNYDAFDLIDNFFKINEQESNVDLVYDNIKLAYEYIDCLASKDIKEGCTYININKFFENLYYYIPKGKGCGQKFYDYNNSDCKIRAYEDKYNLFNKCIKGKLNDVEHLQLFFFLQYHLGLKNYTTTDTVKTFEDYKKYFRIVCNLIRYSTVSEKTIPILLTQINDIYKNGFKNYPDLIEEKNGFNIEKIREEFQIFKFLEESSNNKDKIKKIYKLEDSYYLDRQIRILGYKENKDEINFEQICDLADTFLTVFKKCELDDYSDTYNDLLLVFKAMIVTGDYGYKEIDWGRYLYCGGNRAYWRKLFNTINYNKKWESTSAVLVNFLKDYKESSSVYDFVEKRNTQEYFDKLLQSDTPWRYYFFKYDDFSKNCDYGKYYFKNREKCNIEVMRTREWTSTRTFNPYEVIINKNLKNNKYPEIKLKWTENNTKCSLWSFSLKTNPEKEVGSIDFVKSKDMIEEALKYIKDHIKV